MREGREIQALKIKKAMEKGNIDRVRIYAENAIQKMHEKMNYLRLASCLDAVVARLNMQAKMSITKKSMGKLGSASERRGARLGSVMHGRKGERVG